MTKEQQMTENLKKISEEDENVNFDSLLQTIVLLARDLIIWGLRYLVC